MATHDQLRSLVKSHAEGDNFQFYAVTMQLAAKAARGGQSKFAQELRDLVTELRQDAKAATSISPVVPIAKPKGELSSLMTVTYPDLPLGTLVLAAELRKRLDQVLHEQRQRDVLAKYGLAPANRLLLIGAPGTGKTSTAHAFASELNLPLFSIRLDSLLTKFMGESAAKLRLVFDALSETRGVYLFDEVDALGGNRAALNDVGEIRRVLNSFLQFLEEDSSESIIVAATNYPELLDKALFRRFDSMLEFGLPADTDIESIIKNRLASFSLSNLSWKRIVPVARGLSHAEITTAAENAAKITLLDGRTRIKTDNLIDALEERLRIVEG
ncbi:AAA family ATPase [Corynebacterium flavescens]|uniref:AAA family ATPase n=1 Tax=Corynebacterium flavescens TaxID=28028 RepID=UPI000EE45198|nr:AAA family ATPase [Corynebacterium flavescens]